MPRVYSVKDADRLRRMYEQRLLALRELPPRERERFSGTLKHYEELIARYSSLCDAEFLRKEIADSGGATFLTIPN